MTRVQVGPLPQWMPTKRLLGPGFSVEEIDGVIHASAELTREQAADVLARLRGLAFGGLDLKVRASPPLKRAQVRAGRTRDARARRDTTPGFQRAGVRLDEEGRWSLTPEALALKLGESAGRARVLDATCGAGGNAIGFARAGCQVTAVDRDAARLRDAAHNARIYGVSERIRLGRGDAAHAVRSVDCDLVFLDPPWGEADKRRCTLDDLPLLGRVLPEIPVERQVWLKLPPSFDPATLPGSWVIEPVFGLRPGDRHRVKFLVARRAA